MTHTSSEERKGGEEGRRGREEREGGEEEKEEEEEWDSIEMCVIYHFRFRQSRGGRKERAQSKSRRVSERR